MSTKFGTEKISLVFARLDLLPTVASTGATLSLPSEWKTLCDLTILLPKESVVEASDSSTMDSVESLLSML